MMEIFLNIIPQHLICTEIRWISKHIQTFGAALKNFCNIKNCYCWYFNKMDFTAIMVAQKTNQPILYCSEKTKKVWHDQNRIKIVTLLPAWEPISDFLPVYNLEIEQF